MRHIPRIENPRRLAAAFALAVTAQTEVGQGWIARKGNESLFATLRRILPQVFEPSDGRIAELLLSVCEQFTLYVKPLMFRPFTRPFSLRVKVTDFG